MFRLFRGYFQDYNPISMAALDGQGESVKPSVGTILQRCDNYMYLVERKLCADIEKHQRGHPNWKATQKSFDMLVIL